MVLFLTDGLIGNEAAIFDAIRRNAHSTRVFSFGIGNSVNRHLLDGMARAGRGEVEYVLLASDADEAVTTVTLPLLPFRRIVKDYFAVCESYYEAIRTASPSKIEAIDMGRRGLHDEGCDILRDRLNGKIEIDFDTARRLFTLICVLHIRG